MSNPLTKLAGKVGKALGLKLAVNWINGAAEGKKGPEAKAAYWSLVGYKTWTGFGLAIVAAAAVAFGLPDAVSITVGTAAGLLIEAGLLDKAWRGYRPAALTNSAFYRLAAEHPAEIAAAFTAAVVWERGGGCTYGAWCKALFIGTAALASAAIQLGLLDGAWRAPAPRAPLDRILADNLRDGGRVL